jgi:hypothetical protein
MSRRSTLKRRRERKRRKYAAQQKALQLPPVRKISTFELIQELERRSDILADVFAESQQL